MIYSTDLDLFIRRVEDFASPDMDDSFYDAKRMRKIFSKIGPLLHELKQLRMVVVTYLDEK